MDPMTKELIERACRLARTPEERADLVTHIEEVVLPSLKLSVTVQNNGHRTLADILQTALPEDELRRRIEEARPPTKP
ncbi:MAG TPA: hypothetical protein VJK09_01340 [Candidatus Paceibacterota bacterium]